MRILLAAALAVPTVAPAQLDFTPLVDVNQAGVAVGSYVQASFSSEVGPLTPYPQWAFMEDPQVGIGLNGKTIFYARTNATGDELWVTGGTSTQLLADIHPGPGHAYPRSFTVLGDRVYFAATDPVHGRELWSTDGTPAGTQLVGDLVPGPEGLLEETFTEAFRRPDTNKRIVAFGGELFFRGVTPGQGAELWASDGTAAGTRLVVDLWPGANDARPAYLTATSQGVYFAASAGATGNEPWVSDGTAAGTQLVADLVAGASNGSEPRGFTEVGGHVVFDAFGVAGGREVWSTQGPGTGATALDLSPTSEANPYLESGSVVGGFVYFRATRADVGAELFRTDGTLAGTSLAADLRPGPDSSVPTTHTQLGGMSLVQAATPAGPMLHAIDPSGTVTALGAYDNPTQRRGLESGGFAYLITSEEGGGAVLRTDGTPAGTTQLNLPVAAFAPDRLAPLPGDGVLVVGTDPAVGAEPHRATSTSNDVTLFADIDPTVATDGAAVQNLAIVGPRTLYFTADDGTNGPHAHNVYRWDAAGGLVQLLGDAALPDAPHYSDAVGAYTPFWDGSALRVLFTAGPAYVAEQLWVTNGTAASTQRILDPALVPGLTGIQDLTPSGNQVFFTARSEPDAKWRLFVTDGTTAGTQMVATFQQGGAPHAFEGPAELTPYADGVVFATNAGDVLWSDGTTLGTQQLHAGTLGDVPQAFTVARDQVAFFVRLSGTLLDHELYAADLAGSTRIGTWRAQVEGIASPYLAHIGPDLYFPTRKGPTSTLYRTDLTAAGTVAVQTKSTLPEPVIARSVHVGTVPVVLWRYAAPSGSTAMFNGVVHTALDATGIPTLPANLAAGGPDSQFAGGGSLRFTASDFITAGIAWQPFLGAQVQLFERTDLELLETNAQLVRDLHVVDGRVVLVMDDPDSAGEEIYAADLGLAYVTDLDVTGNSYRIEMSDPILGGPVRISGLGAPAGVPTMVFAAGVLDMPITLGTLPTTPLWLNPANLIPIATKSGSAWTHLTSVPNAPALIGKPLGLQAGNLDAQTGLIHASNALVMGLGL